MKTCLAIFGLEPSTQECGNMTVAVSPITQHKMDLQAMPLIQFTEIEQVNFGSEPTAMAFANSTETHFMSSSCNKSF
jgi:hypothetical protein